MRKYYSSSRLLSSIIVLAWCPICIDAFSQSTVVHNHLIQRHSLFSRLRNRRSLSINNRLQESSDDFQDDLTNLGGDEDRLVQNDLGLEIVRGTGLENAGELSDETWEELETGGPSRWVVLKNLLGVNIFTYILAMLIFFFISMNAAFGPGWLGQSMGWENVGEFTKISDSLPLNVDVSRSDYLL